MTCQLRRRFQEAFTAYAIAQTHLNALKRGLTPGGDSAGIHGVNAQLAIVGAAEHDYRAVRLEYIGVLLRDE